MKSITFYFCFIILFWSHIAFSETITEITNLTNGELIQNATFDQDARRIVPEKSKQAIGYAYDMTVGHGFTYNSPYSEKYSFWTTATYASETPVFVDKFSPSTEVAAVFSTEKNHIRIAGGLEKIFLPTESPYWGFIAGIGAGVEHLERESKYHRQLCGFFCGFDPNSPFEKSDSETFAFVGYRLGLTWRERVIGQSKLNINLLFSPNILRFPSKLELVGPDGRTYPHKELTSLFIEVMAEI